jgi:hypothetical protein
MKIFILYNLKYKIYTKVFDINKKNIKIVI